MWSQDCASCCHLAITIFNYFLCNCNHNDSTMYLEEFISLLNYNYIACYNVCIVCMHCAACKLNSLII